MSMSSRITGTSPPTSAVSTAPAGAPKKPESKQNPSAANPELAPSLEVLASIAALPPPEQSLANADPLLALEPMLGEPTGEKIGDPFAHDWIHDLAEKARA